jgi:hypothetical protein
MLSHLDRHADRADAVYHGIHERVYGELIRKSIAGDFKRLMAEIAAHPEIEAWAIVIKSSEGQIQSTTLQALSLFTACVLGLSTEEIAEMLPSLSSDQVKLATTSPTAAAS